MRKIAPLILAVIVGMSACRTQSHGERPVSRELRVTVHLLHFDGLPSLTTRISDSEARRVVAEANRIWSKAGISTVVESVRSEEAVPNADALGWLTTSHENEGPDAVLANLALIRPAGPFDPDRHHIYFIGTLPCNGITMATDAMFVQDEPQLMQVPGGGREPRARVLAHELGHTLGLLGHAPERDQLMFPGSTGVRLTESEIETASQFITSMQQRNRRRGPSTSR
jgi:hypothetical protein